MKTTGNTILITGGGSGIGLETAKLFAAKGNQVIITGRDQQKLDNAIKGIDNLQYIACDITDQQQLTVLAERLAKDFPALNIIMNNAGIAYLNTLKDPATVHELAIKEMTTNYFAVVNLTSLLLPRLQQQEHAAIINVSSIVAYTPSLSLATYSASKAALHAYTQTLRLSLAGSGVKVFEVMPPLVDTELAKDIPSAAKLTPAEVAQAVFDGVAQDDWEIRMGMTVGFHQAFFSQSEGALLAMNGNAHA